MSRIRVYPRVEFDDGAVVIKYHRNGYEIADNRSAEEGRYQSISHRSWRDAIRLRLIFWLCGVRP